MPADALGDFRSQCLTRHGINPQSQNIPSPASEEFIAMLLVQPKVPFTFVTQIFFLETMKIFL